MANSYYNNYDSSIPNNYLAYEIGENVAGECANLQDDSGTSGQDESNCDVLNNDLIPALVAVYETIKVGNRVIYTNDESKCDEDSADPTLASILSRILRFDQAVACILCTYDPKLIAYLKSGRYPQVLMGGGSNSSYPVWQNPSTTPTQNSQLPITSGGVYDAIQQAILSVFHKATDDAAWVEAGGSYTYAYYATVPGALATQDMSQVATDDKALILNGADGTNQEYVYDGSNWEAMDVIGEPNNYAVIEVEKGYFADNELYYLHDSAGNKSWNLMDASIATIEARISALEDIYEDAVLSADSNEYLFGVKTTLAQAQAVPATAGKQTITLVIGS